MEQYNRLISAHVLDGYENMLDKVPQPQMLGGKRMRKYVLPGSTEYDYPGTLSVGTMDGKYASTLGGQFFKDFNQGFPMVENLEGGAVYLGADGQVHSTPRMGNPRRVGGKFPKELKSLGKDLAKTAVKQGVKSLIEDAVVAGAEGGRRRGALKKTMTSIGKELGKAGKEIFREVVVPESKKALKSYMEEKMSSPAPAGGRRKKKTALQHVGKFFGDVGKELGSAGKEIFREVIVPEGKKAAREYITQKKEEFMRPSAIPVAEAVPVGKGRKPKGGVLIRDKPEEFHSSVYPPALASYSAQMPRGKDAYGRGRAKLPASGAKRNSARGAIVAEVMKKHGLSLPQASKYVKEHGLY